VAFNVCAIPESLFEATLVGHAKGAFTGAIANAAGLLVQADGGTLFFDEIGSLPLTAQAKLLRLVEGHPFHALGDTRERRSNFRVVAATNENLAALVRAERVREDLLFRLRGAVLDVPPLASRLEDVPELVQYFLRAQRSAPLRRITGGALQVLQGYSWPGNVRQLRAVVERAVALADSPILDVADMCMALEPELASERISVARDVAPPPELVQALGASAGDTAEAARLLGVSRRTLYRWLEESGLPTPKRRHRKRDGQQGEDESRRTD
jgi:DNA-binding NtrC family response regulator